MLQADRRPRAVRAFNFFVRSPALAADALLQRARRRAGLRDFGPDFNEEALQVLLRSINEEAKLHPFGRLMVREKLSGQLENRLWANHWWKKYPEILELEVLPILLITGLQRTGTTRMQRLLSRQPGARPLLSWEALYPAPVGVREENRTRIARTRRNERAVKWLSPTFHAIHPIYHDQPEEDVLLLDQHFMSSTTEAILHTPSYASWLEGRDPAEAYAYEKKLLQLLQWQRPGDYWVLKSPHHLEYLPAFFRLFPASTAIWMHRPVEECVPSFLSMLYHSRRMFSEQVAPEEISEHWLPKLGRMLGNGLRFRRENPGRVLDIGYRELMEDETAVVERLSGVISASPSLPAGPGKTYRSSHRYTGEDWGLPAAELRRRFSFYLSQTDLSA